MTVRESRRKERSGRKRRIARPRRGCGVEATAINYESETTRDS
jgi:hypothetical protein